MPLINAIKDRRIVRWVLPFGIVFCDGDANGPAKNKIGRHSLSLLVAVLVLLGWGTAGGNAIALLWRTVFSFAP